MTLRVQAPNTSSFDQFVQLANLFSDPESLKKNIEEYRATIVELDKAKDEYKYALEIAPTVEDAMKLLQQNKDEAKRLKEREIALDKIAAALDKDIRMEAKERMKEVKKREASFVENELSFDTRSRELRSAISTREDALVAGEEKLKDKIEEYHTHNNALKEKQKKVNAAYAS